MDQQGNPMTITIPPGIGRWVIVGVVGILLLWFLIIPAVKGYLIYNHIKAAGVPDTYVENITGVWQLKTTCDTNLASTQSQLSASETLVNTTQASMAAMKQNYDTQVATLTAQSVAQQTQITNLTTTLAATTSQLQTYAAGIAGAARTVCCIQHISDPSITGYDTSTGQINCVKFGGQNLTC